MNNLKEFRNQVGLTQARLAADANLGTASRIANYESEIRQPSLDDCRALVAALAAAGAVNEAGEPVTLDDVFPPDLESQPRTAMQEVG